MSKKCKCRRCRKGEAEEIYGEPGFCDECLAELDDEDIPTVTRDDVNSATQGLGVREWEKRNGRGFWGNASSGYIYDKDL